MSQEQRTRPAWPFVLMTAAGTVLLVLAFLVALVEGIAFDRSFYRKEYAQNVTAAYVGVSPETLEGATDALLEYLQGRRASLDMEAQVGEGQREYYTEREKLHMADVRDLNMGAYAFMWTGFVAGTLLVVASAAYCPERRRVWKAAFLAILGVLCCFGILGVWAALDFSSFWTAFHHVFFRNDLWLFDPRESLLIRMFEERFFFDLVGLILGWFLAGTGCALVITGLCARADRDEAAPPGAEGQDLAAEEGGAGTPGAGGAEADAARPAPPHEGGGA